MTWHETLKVIISGLNFLPVDQKQQLLSSLEIMNRTRPEKWQELIRDYFQLTRRICAPNTFLTQKLEAAEKEFEFGLVVEEVEKEIFQEVLKEE